MTPPPVSTGGGVTPTHLIAKCETGGGVKKRSGELAVIILAAGKGTRMRSELPKALHKICGRPMLWSLIETVKKFRPKKVVVVAGYGFESLKRAFSREALIVRQKSLLGSGHAVQQAARHLENFNGSALVLYCDTPLLSAEVLQSLLDDHKKHQTDCTLLSVRVLSPEGYGRITKNGSRVEKIVEQMDASASEKKIREINVGCYVFDNRKLFGALKKVLKNPKKKEYYLTDTIEILSRKGGQVRAVRSKNLEETLGINTRHHLAEAQRIMQEKILKEWIKKGVLIRDPRTTTIDSGVRIGRDTEILPHTVIETGCVIGKNCVIGPFARLRGASKVEDQAVVGNFVEIVRSYIGHGSQVKHLSYLGDAVVGKSVNIGAGTITANYDGKKKQRTVIKDRAQIGSGTVLIAPVVIGRGAKTGAGSIVTKGKNVPDGRVVAGVPARLL